MSNRIAAIVVSAGEGIRMAVEADELPKQFFEVDGRPLFVNAILPFEAHPLIDDITVVLPPELVEGWKEKLLGAFGFHKIKRVVPGGKYRRDSVQLGMDAASEGQPWPEDALVAVHDGVRPMLTIRLLGAVIDAALKSGAAVPALKIKDTVAETDDSADWASTVDRSRLRIVQTPQILKAVWLQQAYQDLPGEDTTDDAQLVHALGHPITFVDGDVMNIKVTDQMDLELVRCVSASKMR